MGRIFVTFTLLFLGIVVIAPIATMTVRSLRIDYVETRAGERLIGQVKSSDDVAVAIRVHGESVTKSIPRAEVLREGRIWSLRQYDGLLTEPGRQAMLAATLLLAGASALIALIIGLPIGLLLGITDLPGRRALELASVLPLVLPPILLAIATYHDLVALRPVFLRAVVVFGLSLWPLVSLFTARAVRATGAEAIDAARVQARPREVLLRIALRPALPGAVAGALLAFAFVVSDFAVPDFLGVTTAKNTIRVYANAVFSAWQNDGDAGAATAVGMPATLLSIAAFSIVLLVERRRRGAATVGGAYREPEPVPLGGARIPALLLVVVVLLASLGWPMVRHLETAAGANFGNEVARAGATTRVVDTETGKPASLWEGMRRGVRHLGIGESTLNSLSLAAGGALLATLLALLLVEAGRGRPRLDRILTVVAFLPVAVPPMAFAVGWVTLFGNRFANQVHAPMLLLGARLLPFAAFALRAARARIDEDLLAAGAVAGLSPLRRALRITLPLIAPGVLLGLLLAFLFGLREVDAIVFTRQGGETLPVQLYNMIHFGYDVQVAGLSILWTGGVVLLLVIAALLAGGRFRSLP